MMTKAAPKRPGRPRTTSCVEDHRGGPCARCASERARRYRRGQKMAEIRARDRSRYAQRAAEVSGIATVSTALRRGTIVAPGRCDNCGARDVELHARHPAPVQARRVAWLCPSCVRYVRSVGADLVLHWKWPGAARPRRRKGHPRFDAEAHASALAAVREIPSGVEQYRSYADHYLAAAGGRERWLAEGLTAGAGWTPTPDASVNRLWRWYVSSWWDTARERYDRQRWLADDGEVVRFEPAPVVERAPRLPEEPVASVRSKTAAPGVDLSAALDEAMAAFDAHVAEIEARLARELAPRARGDGSDDPRCNGR